MAQRKARERPLQPEADGIRKEVVGLQEGDADDDERYLKRRTEQCRDQGLAGRLLRTMPSAAGTPRTVPTVAATAATETLTPNASQSRG